MRDPAGRLVLIAAVSALVALASASGAESKTGSAQDTGGAINGRHIDVYRPPPAIAGDPGQVLSGQRIYVIKPTR